MSDSERMDWILAEHCAPTLMNIKQASLVTVMMQKFHHPETAIQDCADKYRENHLTFEVLRSSGEKVHLFVYRRDQLEKTLGRADVKQWLSLQGYESSWTLEQKLDKLRRRFESWKTTHRFPHEVGVFLGYPLEDVIQYIENNSAEPVAVGTWKAYSHRDEANRTFTHYRNAKKLLLNSMCKGADLCRQIHGASVS